MERGWALVAVAAVACFWPGARASIEKGSEWGGVADGPIACRHLLRPFPLFAVIYLLWTSSAVGCCLELPIPSHSLTYSLWYSSLVERARVTQFAVLFSVAGGQEKKTKKRRQTRLLGSAQHSPEPARRAVRAVPPTRRGWLRSDNEAAAFCCQMRAVPRLCVCVSGDGLALLVRQEGERAAA